jgi:hypothetical protein
LSSLLQIQEALANQIRSTLSGTADPLIESLQVEPLMMFNPTPPAVDIYPADPSQEPAGFGRGNREVYITVRARVSTAEHEKGQELLLSMMDYDSTTSLEKAIEANRTLGGVVGKLVVSGPSGFGIFPDPGGDGSLLGCTWSVRVFP